MAGHEHCHLTADLQRRNIAVEIDPIQTLDVQPTCPSSRSFTVNVAITHMHRTRSAEPAPGSAVRGEASLGAC